MRKEGLQRPQPLMNCSRCFHQASCPASAGCWNGIMTEHQPTSQHYTRIVTLHCINNAIYYHLITNITKLITESLTHIMLHLYTVTLIFIQSLHSTLYSLKEKVYLKINLLPPFTHPHVILYDFFLFCLTQKETINNALFAIFHEFTMFGDWSI